MLMVRHTAARWGRGLHRDPAVLLTVLSFVSFSTCYFSADVPFL